jgi:hypothetical protein
VTDTRTVVQRFVDHFLAVRIVEGLSILNEDGVYTIIGTTPDHRNHTGFWSLPGAAGLARSTATVTANVRRTTGFAVSEIVVEKDCAFCLQ